MTLQIQQRAPDHWKVYRHGLFVGEIRITGYAIFRDGTTLPTPPEATFTPSSANPPNLTLQDLHTLARFLRRRTRKCTSHPPTATASPVWPPSPSQPSPSSSSYAQNH